MESKQPPKNEFVLTAVHFLRYLLPLLVLGLGVHLILPQLASLEKSYQVIKDMVIWAFALAVFAQSGSYLGSGYLLKALVNLSRNKLSVLSGTMMTLAGASFGMVAGGMVGVLQPFTAGCRRRT